MYQLSTCKPLASSKKFFPSIQECKVHLKQCVKETNKYRATKEKTPVSSNDIEAGCRLLKLNLEVNPQVYDILGPEKEICVLNLQETSYKGSSDED